MSRFQKRKQEDPDLKINENFIEFIEITDEIGIGLEEEILNSLEAVSYTHLDVYKRQGILSMIIEETQIYGRY